MTGWKRVAVFGVSFGIGLAVALGLIVAAIFWYEARPKPPKPWNAIAFKAEYYRIDMGGPPDGIECYGSEKKCLKFLYNIRNETDSDYRLDSDSGLNLMARLEDTKSLSFSKGEIRVPTPLFIPARQVVRIQLILPSYGFDQQEPNYRDDAARRKFHDQLEEFARTKLENLDGFVMFDDNNRYQINFPSGWKKVPTK